MSAAPPPKAELRRLHLIVEGRVQGVGFRFFIRDLALKHNLCGWVRNRGSGAVEILAEGSEEDLRRMLAAASSGPPLAHVTDVQVQWQPARGDLPRPFTIAPTSWE
jgi:acylphosphatase